MSEYSTEAMGLLFGVNVILKEVWRLSESIATGFRHRICGKFLQGGAITGKSEGVEGWS